jgi:lipopolysaccharide/colanic/teichoic acid biosynthesis glycosyltransferase
VSRVCGIVPLDRNQLASNAPPTSATRPSLAAAPRDELEIGVSAPGTSLQSFFADCGRWEHRRSTLKRGADLILAAAMLICLAPLFAVAALGIRLDSPGPVLFRQRRIGRDGQEFTMMKFRSMSAHATHEPHHRYVTELAGETVERAAGDLRKLTHDPRVTRVGAIIRKSSIDEWPQLLNVLAGQMSIVGPRPAVKYELDLYRPEHFERFNVRPGITGLWQVSGRNRLGFNEMLELDVEYARRHGLALDIWIMLRTPLAVLRADTA